MTKIDLNDLKKYLLLESADIFLIDLSELFSFNPYIRSEEVVTNIIRRGLREWEFYLPLFIDIPMYQSQMQNNQYTFVDNFHDWMDGIIDESQIVLVPNSINKINIGGYNYAMSGSRVFTYKAPTMKFIGVPVVVGWNTYTSVYGICNRPLVAKYNEDGSYTGDSGIYFFPPQGVDFLKFRDCCMMKLMQYVVDLKGNLQLPNLPIELFQNAENRFSILKGDMEDWFRSSLNKGYLVN